MEETIAIEKTKWTQFEIIWREVLQAHKNVDFKL